MKLNIAVVSGDGIGPEIIAGAKAVLDKVASVYGHTFSYCEALLGGAAIDRFGEPMPAESVSICQTADSVLLGAVGGPKWDGMPPQLRPEQALLGIRKALRLYANLRPATIYPELSDASPLKEDVLSSGTDILVVRELTGGIYFGARSETEQSASDTETYSVDEISRIARCAFSLAMTRHRRLVSVDKANVLCSSRLWRKTVSDVAKEYPEVTLSHMYVDNAAMQLVLNPAQFDVIVTSNLFGDILSDLASAITGSIGMLPSASIGDDGRGMYEPIHGSAPDLAGKDVANPIATILSAAMMLRISFHLEKEAAAIEAAVRRVLREGYRTADIQGSARRVIGCDKMAELIASYIV